MDKPMSRYPEYKVLRGAVTRCHNPSCSMYKWYGARGIVVCDEWRERGGFWKFLEHIGERPSPKHSLDRIDNDGNYEPGNVRWATRYEQHLNRSDNKLLTYQGETKCMREWADTYQVCPIIFASRIACGWSVPEAAGIKKRARQNKKSNAVPYAGVTFENVSKRKPYRARARIHGVYKNLGRYPTQEEAAMAHDIAVLKSGRPLDDCNFDLAKIEAKCPEIKEMKIKSLIERDPARTKRDYYRRERYKAKHRKRQFPVE